MKIVVCVRQGLDGAINPFDACAYEEALKIENAQVTLLSMGPLSAKDFLWNLTRQGAAHAVLLSDAVFAGADTLATAYALSLAVKKLAPDYVFCGRQTLIGDTAQTGPMLSVYADRSLITGVMRIVDITDTHVTCDTREQGTQQAPSPALLTVERINTLRLPRLRAKLGELTVWSAQDIGADPSRCGLKGSPTRVLKTFENASGKRKCHYVSPSELDAVLTASLKKQAEKAAPAATFTTPLKKVWVVGEDPLDFAKQVSDDITVIDRDTPQTIADRIRTEHPSAVLWGSNAWSKQTAAQVAALLHLGLCADCTALETDGKTLVMYRPALSGSVLAKIISQTTPAMATVRTTKQSSNLMVAAGYGAKDHLDRVKRFAERYGAEQTATRKAVDNDLLPYAMQVGLTGKTVAPSVYVAFGVSGAVHHIVGMQQAGTVIAVNRDKDAPIFDYVDYGIVADINEVLS